MRFFITIKHKNPILEQDFLIQTKKEQSDEIITGKKSPFGVMMGGKSFSSFCSSSAMTRGSGVWDLDGDLLRLFSRFFFKSLPFGFKSKGPTKATAGRRPPPFPGRKWYDSLVKTGDGGESRLYSPVYAANYSRTPGNLKIKKRSQNVADFEWQMCYQTLVRWTPKSMPKSGANEGVY